MAVGLSGDSGPSFSGVSGQTLSLIELRTLTNLLEAWQGTNQAKDGIGRVRNDQAFELQVATPLPGAGR